MKTKLEPRLCKNPDCGIQFQPNNTTHRFCSRRCRDVYKNKYKRAWEKKAKERKSYRAKARKKISLQPKKICHRCHLKKIVNRFGFCKTCYKTMQRSIPGDEYVYCTTEFDPLATNPHGKEFIDGY